MITSKQIRKEAEIFEGNYNKEILYILADIMERLENLDSEFPKVHKPYYESKEIGKWAQQGLPRGHPDK